MIRRSPTWLRALLLTLIIVGFAFCVTGVLFNLDARFYDVGMTARPVKTPEGIYVAGLDEKFMEGRSPALTPRDKLAALLEAMVPFKPKAVALDVVLDSRVESKVDARLRQAIKDLTSAGTLVILSDIPAVNDFESSNLQGMTARGTVLPYFAEVAQTGSVLQTTDGDGVVRELNWPSQLAPAPYQLIEKGLSPQLKESLKDRLQNEGVPLNYYGPSGAVQVISAQEIVKQPMVASLFSDAIVLVGATYPGSQDYVLSPWKKPIYGVEVLAQSALTLRDGGLRRSSHTPAARLFDIGLVALLTGAVLILARRGTVLGVLSALLILGGASALAVSSAIVAPDQTWWANLLGHRYHPAASYFIAIPLAAAFGIAWRQLEQAQELRMVRDTFAAYVGGEVLDELGGKMPKLGGEVRQIAVLFCDIRGYSALAEQMQDRPEELMTELNNHFLPLVNALKLRGAYVDNYVGDLVMALFGAPIQRGTLGVETRMAVRAALDFVRLVNERNHLRVESGQPPIEIGVGVHCGDAVVGNLGTLDPAAGGKIHYTAIGDAVNLASRVESTTRKFDVPLLITEEAVLLCKDIPADEPKDLPEWEFVAETTVKGRQTPVRLYRPLAT